MSKSKSQSVMWGVFLIYLGIILGLRTLEVVAESETLVWALLFGGAAGLGLVAYLAGDRKVWPLLFPAVVSGGIAAFLFADAAGGLDGDAGRWMGGLFMILLSFPFWFGFLTGGRQQWWALIPGWVLLAIGLILIFVGEDSDLLPSFVLLAVGLPFLVIFFLNRQNWWALIPAGVLILISLALALGSVGGDEWIGPLIPMLISLPFWGLFIWRPEMWWALIPAGVLLSSGLSALAGLSGEEAGSWAGSIFFVGLGGTFGLLWLQRKRLAAKSVDVRWAIYPAVICLMVAAVILLAGQASELLWGILLIVAGLILLLRAMLGRGDGKKPGEVGD